MIWKRHVKSISNNSPEKNGELGLIFFEAVLLQFCLNFSRKCIGKFYFFVRMLTFSFGLPIFCRLASNFNVDAKKQHCCTVCFVANCISFFGNWFKKGQEEVFDDFSFVFVATDFCNEKPMVAMKFRTRARCIFSVSFDFCRPSAKYFTPVFSLHFCQFLAPRQSLIWKAPISQFLWYIPGF